MLDAQHDFFEDPRGMPNHNVSFAVALFQLGFGEQWATRHTAETRLHVWRRGSNKNKAGPVMVHPNAVLPAQPHR